eukprot:jgi/Mesen1/4478/ME000228S03453
MVDGFQARTHASRLQIPMLYGVDAVHGHNNVLGATIFPHHVALGATRNPALVRAIGAAAAKARALFSLSLSPPLSHSLDPPLLCHERVTDASDPASGVPGSLLVAACAKHFIGDGATAGGVDQGDARVSEEELRRVHLPPYVEAIKRGVASVMVSYSSWNGAKMHAHRHLLSDVLKGELGFAGVLVSDWEALQKMPGDWPQQVRDAVNAGLDMIMVPYDYKAFIDALLDEVRAGRVAEARIDDAVRRILALKQSLGLFENPYAQRQLLPCVGCPEHRDIARRAVRESLVLLKNERRAGGGAVLPLPLKGQRVLVAGTHAHNIGLQCGGWSIAWQGESGAITPGTTVLDGIKAVAGERGAASVAHAELPTGDEADGNYDYAIVVLGEPPYAEIFGDDKSLQLPPLAQSSLAKLAEKMPVVLVIISGRPLEVEHLVPKVDALVAAWLPGTEGGGIAEVLFGPDDFKGRLPVTWFRSAAQLPMVKGSPNYDPLFPFGFGLDKEGNELAAAV